MSMTPGSGFGAYELVETIGAGGMGEVWRARDTTLKRDVAIKFLPDAFVADAERLSRFRREAEILASLNHPNIATIHGLERSGDRIGIVMELIEGPTLADLIARGPLAPETALSVARQIADALEAAHARQIVHRDLKPANIKLKDGETVKVLDFGISKPGEIDAVSGPAVATTPAVTEAGVLLGTAGYMSPEQARGKAVDQRADIWAFGCLLFEMLTGQPAFGGEDVMLTLARVLDRESDLSSLPRSVGPAVRRTVALCLVKDPQKRLADIRDVRLLLDGAMQETGAIVAAERARLRPWWRRSVAPAAAFLAGIGLTAAAVLSLWPATPLTVTALPNVRPLLHADGLDHAISPNGRQIAYVSRRPGTQRAILLTHDLDSEESRAYPLTDMPIAPGGAGENPFYSFDGSEIVMMMRGTGIVSIDLESGEPQVLAPYQRFLGSFRSGVWTSDDRIYFISNQHVYLMPPEYTESPEQVTLDEYGARYESPSLLPGETELLVGIRGDGDTTARVAVIDLETGEADIVLPNARSPRYEPVSGHIVFLRGTTLYAAPFDPAARVLGEAFPLPYRVNAPDGGIVDFVLSRDGSMSYLPNQPEVESRVFWIDRAGKRESAIAENLINARSPALSPVNDNELALLVERGGETAIEIHNLATSSNYALWRYPGTISLPAFSHDGARLGFTYFPDPRSWVLASQPVRANAGDPDEIQSGIDEPRFFVDWAADFILLMNALGFDSSRFLRYSQGDGNAPKFLVDSSGFGGDATLSRDARWIAYTTNASGDPEIWMSDSDGNEQRPIPQVTGSNPAWSPTTDEIFYVDGTSFYAVGYEEQDGELVFRPPVPLFDLGDSGAAGSELAGYAVASDGRFLVVEQYPRHEIIVVQGFAAELRRRARMQ